jgi:type II secretory pathway pseudopilin PulG
MKASLNTIGRRRNRALGFTLVELLIASGITVAIIFMLGQAFTHSSRAWTRSTALMQSSQSARTAIDLLNRDLHSVFVSPTLPIYWGAFTTPSNSTLSFWASVPSPTGVFDLCYVRYYATPDYKLKRELSYAATPGSTSMTTITSELVSNVWCSPTQTGCTLSFYFPNGSYSLSSATPAGGTSLTPSRVFVQLKLANPLAIRSGSNITIANSYETSVFLLQGMR